MPENPNQTWWIPIICAGLVFAGVCVSAFFSRREMRSKADEKSVEERLALQSLEISRCKDENVRCNADRIYLRQRVEELNTHVLSLSRSMVHEFQEMLSATSKNNEAASEKIRLAAVAAESLLQSVEETARELKRHK